MATNDTHREELQRIAARKEIAIKSDDYFESAQHLADLAAGAKLRTAQVRNLETLAYSTDKISDLLDAIKKQIGRSGNDQRWRYMDLGESLLNALGGLRDDADMICGAIGERYAPLPQDFQRQVHLELCREYLKHFAAHYLYSRPAEGGSNG